MIPGNDMSEVINVSNISIALKRDRGRFSDRIFEEFARYERVPLRREKISGSLLIRGGGKARLPAKAALKGFWLSSGLRNYFLGNGQYWTIQDSMVFSDLKNRRVEIILGRKDPEGILGAARNAIKWLIIKCAESQGYIYAHAAAARFGKTHLLIPGHSGAGKSSFLMRVIRSGGTVLNDDVSLIHRETGHMIPLALSLHVKGDFAKRFKVPPRERWGWFHGPSAGTNEREQWPRVVLFPEVWASPESRLTRISSAEAAARLEAIYMKEVNWNAFPVSRKRRREAHRRLLKRADSYVIRAGISERNVQAKLDKLVRKYEN